MLLKTLNNDIGKICRLCLSLYQGFETEMMSMSKIPDVINKIKDCVSLEVLIYLIICKYNNGFTSNCLFFCFITFVLFYDNMFPYSSIIDYSNTLFLVIRFQYFRLNWMKSFLQKYASHVCNK